MIGSLPEDVLPPPKGSVLFLFSKWVKSLAKGSLFYSAIYVELYYRYLKSVFLKVHRGRWVIADRYMTDLRYFYKGNPMNNYPVWRYLACRFFPSPDLFVLLDNHAEIIHSRKKDLTIEQIEQLRLSYQQAVCSHPHEIIHTDRSPEDIADEILSRILRLSAAR